jgi:hypothetical protein
MAFVLLLICCTHVSHAGRGKSIFPSELPAGHRKRHGKTLQFKSILTLFGIFPGR